jgi:hypothetical protein
LAHAQEVAVNGNVKEPDSGAGIPGVVVTVEETQQTVLTDNEGVYQLTLPGGKVFTFVFSKPGYINQTIQVELGTAAKEQLNDIFLNELTQSQQDIPTISIAESDSENAMESQTIHGLLGSSKDVFTSAAAYTFGPARFRIRGYESDQQAVLLNGFIMNDAVSGQPYWSNWGGLNDVMRNVTVTTDASPTGYMYEPLGGVTNIITHASDYRPGVKLVYSNSNRSYRNRAMATASTGMMNNNWALTVSVSRRWSQEGYKEATFYDANSFFLAAEKKLNDAHSLNFTFLTAMYENGVGGGATQEVYDIMNDNYYNPYWGYQNGKKRNSRVRSGNKPLFVLEHSWTPSVKTKITTSAGYWFGKGGYTALNWRDAKDPRPDYYRYLPSYYGDPADQERIINAWQTNPAVSQIDWDYLYYANRNNSFWTVEDANGIEGNNYSGKRSFFVVEDRRSDISQFQFNTNFKHELKDNWTMTGGINLDLFTGDNFNVIDDLLGGEYWLDIDQFAERDFDDELKIQNDLNNPNRIVKEGDIYSHHYKSHIKKYGGWIMGELSGASYNIYLGGNYQYNTFWRQGLMRKGLFEDNSYGDSEKQNFHIYGVKAGGEYRITGRHIVQANAGYGTKAPHFRNSFVSPRTRNSVVPNLKEEVYYSGDLNYFYRSPSLDIRLSGYYSRLDDQVKIMSFYHEDLRTFVNYAMSDIDKQYMGAEFGTEYKITSALSANMVAALGQHTYESNPSVIVTQDNNEEVKQADNVYTTGFKQSGTPMLATTVGLKYNSPKYWWVGVNASYFDEIFLDFNPVPRAPDSSNPANPYWRWSLPEQLPSAITVDAFAGKSWRLDDYYISLSANLSNITNNKDFITGGYEQLRYKYDVEDGNFFKPKYYYYYGFNYFLNLSVSF